MNEIQLLNHRMKRHLKAKGLSVNTVLAHQGLKVLSLGQKKVRDSDIFVSDSKESLRDVILRQSELRAHSRRPSAKFESLDIQKLPQNKGIVRKSTFLKQSTLHRKKSVQFEDSFLTTNLFTRMQTKDESVYSRQSSGIVRSEWGSGGILKTKQEPKSALLPQKSSFLFEFSPMNRRSEDEKYEEQKRKLRNLVQGVQEKKPRNLLPPLPRHKQRTAITVTKYLNHHSSFPRIACVPDSSQMYYMISKTEPIEELERVHEQQAVQRPRQFLSEEAQKALQKFKSHERTRSLDYYELERQNAKLKKLNQNLQRVLGMS